MSEPKSGEVRTRTRFAWLPVTLDDGSRVWLKRYRVAERWCPAGQGLGRWDPDMPAQWVCAAKTKDGAT